MTSTGDQEWQSPSFSFFKGSRSNCPDTRSRLFFTFAGRKAESQLIEAVADPWFALIQMIQRDPNAMYEIDWRKWEEILAGAWQRAGFDEVILTPRSADRGCDVIATKHGVGSIRIFDDMKAYKPGRVVTATEVRAMLGVINSAGNVSKGIITTTSEFAPRLMDDP